MGQVRKSGIITLSFVVLTFISFLLFSVYSDIERIQYERNIAVQNVLYGKWLIIESIFYGKAAQAGKDGTLLKERIIRDIDDHYQGDFPSLKEDLYDLDKDNHPIVNILAANLKGYYFDNIVNDANDPFVIVLNEEGLILTDTSVNCSAVGRTRTFPQEHPMHGNVELSEIAFNRLAVEQEPNYTGGVFPRPIMFQFESHSDGIVTKEEYDGIYEEFNFKKAQQLSSYDLEGIKQYFLESGGNWKKTFEALEFLWPVYLYPDRDLAGVPRVNNRGEKIDNRVLGIVVVFNFRDVLENAPREREKLVLLDSEINRLQEQFVSDQRYLLLKGLATLVMALIIIGLTVKITRPTR